MKRTIDNIYNVNQINTNSSYLKHEIEPKSKLIKTSFNNELTSANNKISHHVSIDKAKLTNMENLLINLDDDSKNGKSSIDLMKKNLINEYTFTCSFLLLGLARSGKTTFLAKYIYEWCKFGAMQSKLTFALVLTQSPGTKKTFLNLENYCRKRCNFKILHVYTFEDFIKYYQFYEKMKLLTSKPEWNGRIFCIVDDRPEALSGEKKDGVDTNEFWSMLLSRGSHNSTQTIFSIQSYRMIHSTLLKSQIKVVTIFNRINRKHLKDMLNELGAFATFEISGNEINSMLPPADDQSKVPDNKIREYLNFTIGVNDNNCFIKFIYQVPNYFLNKL